MGLEWGSSGIRVGLEWFRVGLEWVESGIRVGLEII